MPGPLNETDQIERSARERRPSEKVAQLGQKSLPGYYSCYKSLNTSTAEARREKENEKWEAAERAEQRKKKNAVSQQKAAQRRQANSDNGRVGKLTVFIFRPALYMVLTVGSKYQSLIATLFESATLLLAAIPQYV